VSRAVRIVGPGRAGQSLAGAIETLDGWSVDIVLGRDDDVTGAAAGVALLVLAVPDAAVAGVAAAVAPVPTTVVAHLSGSLGLAPLARHRRAAVLHPLVSLPDPVIGAQALRAGAWFGLASGGDPLAADLVAALGGHAVAVTEGDWPRYHAAAAVAANHLVGLLGQVDRVAATIGVPLAAYLDLARGAVDNVAALGPAPALTGPVARGDDATIERHRAALPADELAAYDAGVALCRRLLP
jgi:predicted short-subunit dehydrogenase-like oxidoreductase (DUF2520 family)